ncbi:hypothetical protein [Pseudoduganella sp. LjRoot289]|uniref:hypothetical protein n=1 Tax=Pseudoduganella sp. LjRoot289 TaxID=3342314 RepID=UPI003F50A98F
MENRIAALETSTAVLQTAVDALASDVSVLKTDMSAVKIDVAVIKSNYVTKDELHKGLAELGREIRIVQRWLVGLIIAVVFGFLYHGRARDASQTFPAPPIQVAPQAMPSAPAAPAEPSPQR